MAAGMKTGGRTKGTPNKATAARAQALPPDVAPLPPYRYVPIGKLVPYANNARTHSPEQIDKLAALIKEFGWTNPVLIDGQGGIVAGHGRVLAARKLGMTAVPTIELAHLSDAQKRAYVLADNRSALDAGWDDDLLRLELGELRDSGFDLAFTGFDVDELDALFGEDPDGGAGGGQSASLAERFGVPPFSVLNAREGWWQDRKRAWLSLGIQSELGRGDGEASATPGVTPMPAMNYSKRQRGDGQGRPLAEG